MSSQSETSYYSSSSFICTLGKDEGENFSNMIFEDLCIALYRPILDNAKKLPYGAPHAGRPHLTSHIIRLIARRVRTLGGIVMLRSLCVYTSPVTV